MKKLLIILSFLTLGFGKDPFEVPLEKKIYLSNLDQKFLTERQSIKDWFYVIKEFNGRRVAFKMPSKPLQEKQDERFFFASSHEKGFFTVTMEPVTEKTKDLWEELLIEGSSIPTEKGKILEITQDNKTSRYFFHPKVFITYSVEGQIPELEEKAFFHSLSVIKPKK